MSKNLINRIITSAILIAILSVVNYNHHYFFITSIIIIGFIICIEANSIFSKLAGPLFIKKDKKNHIIKKINLKYLILNIITFCYVFFIFCQFSYEIHRLEGPTFFLFVISICFFSDIGGYAIGKTIGGKKLTKISPNKTISGTIGSFIFCIIPLMLFSLLNNFDLELSLNNFIFSFLVSLISQLGDLFISYLKRKVKIKDTGKILPGHGGLLDRVDGILFSLPFSYLLLKIV